MDDTLGPSLPIPAVGDSEDNAVPANLPPIIDSHVHIFPRPIFRALWEWFEAYAWPIRYKGSTPELLDFLFERGVEHIVALQYAHKPGIARDLNQYMVRICRQYAGRVTGMATVFPGEVNAAVILEEAFVDGLQGVKLHAHVQCFDMNSKEMDPIYRTCIKKDKPLVIHAGREPKSESYACDPYLLCRSDKLETVLQAYPDLKICVPHLGMDEFESYQRLIETYDTLWLDTSVACAEFLPFDHDIRLKTMRTDRIMYGSDFPNLPYAWDREIKQINKSKLSDAQMRKILAENAREFYNIKTEEPPSDPRHPQGHRE